MAVSDAHVFPGTVPHNISTITHTKFEVVWTGNDKITIPRNRKCRENDDKREISQRQHKLELQFLCTALHIITTNTHAKFQVNQT